MDCIKVCCLVSLIVVSDDLTYALLLESGLSTIADVEAEIENLKSNLSVVRTELDQLLASNLFLNNCGITYRSI